MTKFDCVMIGLFSGLVAGGALSTYSHSTAKQPEIKHCEVQTKVHQKVEQRIKPVYAESKYNAGTFEHEVKRTE
jgi:hypothetical protein